MPGLIFWEVRSSHIQTVCVKHLVWISPTNNVFLVYFPVVKDKHNSSPLQWLNNNQFQWHNKLDQNKQHKLDSNILSVWTTLNTKGYQEKVKLVSQQFACYLAFSKKEEQSFSAPLLLCGTTTKHNQLQDRKLEKLHPAISGKFSFFSHKKKENEGSWSIYFSFHAIKTTQKYMSQIHKGVQNSMSSLWHDKK